MNEELLVLFPIFGFLDISWYLSWYYYIFWFLVSILVLFLRCFATIYQLCRIGLALGIFFFLQVVGMIMHMYEKITCPKKTRILLQKLQSASSFDEWKIVALELDDHLGRVLKFQICFTFFTDDILFYNYLND